MCPPDPPDDDEPETIPSPVGPDPSSRGSVVLRLVTPEGTSQIVMGRGAEFIFGRSSECDVYVQDAKLSRRHLTIRVRERLEALDLGSLNGTRLRDWGMPRQVPVPLAPGDILRFGDSMLVVEAAPADVLVPRSPAAGNFLSLGGKASLPPDPTWGHDETLVDGLEQTWHGSPLNWSTGISLADGPGADARSPLTTTRRSDPATRPSLAPRGQGFFAELAPVITRISQSTLNIVVLGETGVGKEVLARRIHAESPRAKRPLVSINCAALHEVLLESELFGHERGAFTGAVASKVGLIESAEGGTVFLDELGEMPPSLQVKLLRVLEQREVLRVGSVRPRPIDVRFIAATNRDLELDVEQGRFRKDLYFRLNGYFFYIPPLRERPAEIIPLADKFVLEACLRTGRQPLELSGDVKAILESYEWPGNVRELRTSMDRAVTLAVGPQVLPEHLPLDRMRMSGRWVSSLRDKVSVVDPATSKVLPSIEEDEESLALAKARVPRGSDEERRRVLEALARCGGNQTQAARMLGISRGTLISRMEDYGLARPRKGVGP